MTEGAFRILPQPTDTSCGPTCLHAVYQHYGEDIELSEILDQIDELETGGTLAVHLATHALRRGFRAHIYTYNLQLFDPTWFREGIDLAEKLEAQSERKSSRRLQDATGAYLEYLKLGGRVFFQDLTVALLRRYLDRNQPLLTGLSSTYLYHSAREHGVQADYDDVAGDPGGHFVVLHGSRDEGREILVSDPYAANPLAQHLNYAVDTERLIGAILLGIVTYDANLLVLEPPERP